VVELPMKTTITFGRMNPPTRGHEKLIDHVKELAGDGDHHVFTSQTHDPKRNPLSPEQKHGYLKSSFPNTNIVSKPSPFHALTHLQDEGYKDVTVVVGADRVNEFERIGSHKDFKFDNYDVVSAGERQGGEIENISASGARAAAKEKRYGEFKQMTPTLMSGSKARQMFSDLHTQLEEFNLTEELFSDEEELELFMEAFLPMKYLFEQDTYTAQNMALDTMKGGANYGQDTEDRDRKRLDRQASRRQSETNPWPELLVVRNANDNKIRIIPKADFNSGFQEILIGNYPGSPPMGEMTPQIAFSVMQEPNFEASKTSNRLLKMFGVSSPEELDIGAQNAPGGAGAPGPVGGGMVSPEDQMGGMMPPAPRTPPDGREITDPLSIHPDWDHQPRDLIGAAVMGWNVATGRNPLDGGVPPELQEFIGISETLEPAARRFSQALLTEIPPDYVAYDNANNLGAVTPEWAANGGTESVPKADLVFMNPSTNDFIRANVGVGKQQLLSSPPGEATALFNTLSGGGLVTPFTQRKEVKTLTKNLKMNLNQSFSALEETGRVVKESKEDLYSEATKIYDEIAGKIEDLMAADKALKKIILHEVMTGELKFGPDSTSTATHVIATNKDGTNTQMQVITNSYISRLNDIANVNVVLSPANIEQRIETQETTGDTFIDYLRILSQGMEDSLDLDDLSFTRKDYEPTTDFSLDGGSQDTQSLSGIADPFRGLAPDSEEVNFMNVELKQNLRTMLQRAIEGFTNILDIMRFFSIGVEAIDIDPVNLTTLNERKADQYNIVTVNGKRFRIPVERDAQDIMDDYNYIDAVFRETLLEGRKVRIWKKPKDGKCGTGSDSEWCNNRKRHDYRRELQNYRRKNGLHGKGGDHVSHDKNGKITGTRDPNENMSDNKKEKIQEEHGAGDMGTPELLLKYLKDTPYSGIIGYDVLKQLIKKKKNEVERSRK
jgi:hypothetical protein